ncbi:GrpB family protein [Endozoicomonadaceae bacterium StTr2]
MKKIEVVNYQESWKQDYSTEAEQVRQALAELNPVLHHIGSTSVPGLVAKPVIDILVAVESLDALDQQAARLEELGYEAKGEFGIPGRRYFRKGADKRTHQIHAFAASDDNIQRHLAFRDYLTAFPEIAEEYSELKRQIASESGEDVEAYYASKDEFIRHHEKKALCWHKDVLC